jgi:cytochrome d ubiquinol oxidase subunit II
MLDYETLRLIWWGLLGVLLIGFAIADGFDLGVASLLPFVAKKDEERRIVINTVGPVWEGNQVWLILAGGATFAAWPSLYAVSFSGFYLAIFLALFGLILRPVGFKFRSKMPSSAWRQTWDILLFFGGVVPSLIFGVAVGNLFLGASFHFDDLLRVIYTGTFWELLTPFPLLCGLLSVTMIVLHGGVYLIAKTNDPIAQRARIIVIISALTAIILFAVGGIACAWQLNGFQYLSAITGDAPSNPLGKEVVLRKGAWLHNYTLYPWMMIAPALGFSGYIGVIPAVMGRYEKSSFILSAMSILGIISTVGLSLYPFILPSATHPGHSLTIWDASSSQLTLFIMLWGVIIFLPIVLIYTSWVYRVLRGKVTPEILEENQTNAY